MDSDSEYIACRDCVHGVFSGCGRKAIVWGECKGDCFNKARRSIFTLLSGVLSYERKTTETRLDGTHGNCLLPKDLFTTDIYCSLELHCKYCCRSVDRSPGGKVRAHAVVTLHPWL